MNHRRFLAACTRMRSFARVGGSRFTASFGCATGYLFFQALNLPLKIILRKPCCLGSLCSFLTTYFTVNLGLNQVLQLRNLIIQLQRMAPQLLYSSKTDMVCLSRRVRSDTASLPYPLY